MEIVGKGFLRVLYSSFSIQGFVFQVISEKTLIRKIFVVNISGKEKSIQTISPFLIDAIIFMISWIESQLLQIFQNKSTGFKPIMLVLTFLTKENMVQSK